MQTKLRPLVRPALKHPLLHKPERTTHTHSYRGILADYWGILVDYWGGVLQVWCGGLSQEAEEEGVVSGPLHCTRLPEQAVTQSQTLSRVIRE